MNNASATPADRLPRFYELHRSLIHLFFYFVIPHMYLREYRFISWGKATPEGPLPAPEGAEPSELGKKGSGPRRFPKGDRKALWPRPQARNPRYGKKGVWAAPEGAGYLALRRNEVVWAPGGCPAFLYLNKVRTFFSSRRKEPKADRGR